MFKNYLIYLNFLIRPLVWLSLRRGLLHRQFTLLLLRPFDISKHDLLQLHV